MDKYESLVNCPVCKKEVKVVLKMLESGLVDFAERIGGVLGVKLDDSERFVSSNVKCECGKMITVNMTVTAI